MRPHLPFLLTIAAMMSACSGAALAGGSSSGSAGGCGCVPTSHQVKVPGIVITPPNISIGLPSVGVGYGYGAGSGSGSGSGAGSASGSAEAGVSTSISVNVSTSGSGSGSASGTGQSGAALLGSFGGGGGGGGGGWAPENGVTSDIPDIKIDTPATTRQICAAFKAVVRQVTIEANCLDDKAVPHPASQVFPDRAVAPGYEGEIFRCIAGARMQYTIAEISGAASVDHGQTVICQKNEALYHSAGGAVTCRPQVPARDCNERSLLRRFGAGIKVLALGGGQVCTAWRSETVATINAP